MRYEEPKMDIMEIGLDDIITLSNGNDFKEDDSEDGSWI